MSSDFLVSLLTEHGPWVVLVFYLLWRDLQKDQATRRVLDENTLILTRITTIIQERLPRAGGEPR